MKTKAILFNSPKQLGKTCAMNYLTTKLTHETGYFYKYLSCKTPLHSAVIAFFNVDPDTYFDIYESSQGKETPSEHFRVTLPAYSLEHLRILTGTIYEESYCVVRGNTVLLSLRQAMIYMSEIVMKPVLGEDVFGRYRAGMIDDSWDLIIDDSTAAFPVNGEIRADELPPLIDKLGQDNILLLRFYRDGFTFDNDSRCYVPDGVVDNTLDLYNNADEESFYKEVTSVCLNFLEESNNESE